MSTVPVITIFVRHSSDCKYADDETWKRCRCRKHLRWTHNGQQYRESAGTRSWEEAERVKRNKEDQLAGRAPQLQAQEEMTLAEAIKTFEADKKAQGVGKIVQASYKLQLSRLKEFSNSRSCYTVRAALTLSNMVAFRGTWTYGSSYSAMIAQTRIKHFIRFCFNAGWIDREFKLSPIKVEYPETQPLTDAEYEKVLKAAEGETRLIIELMRWSGLAVRDASTLAKDDLQYDKAKDLYKIVRKRAKTGSHVYVPIPKAVGEKIKRTGACGGYFFWDPRVSAAESLANTTGHAISEAFTKAGVQNDAHMVSHRLRDTFAVDLLQKGVALEHVSKLLGHESVKTTERHYAKWSKGRQDRLDELVTGTWGSDGLQKHD